MKNPGTCDLENTVIALEQAIEKKKKRMHDAQIQLAPSNPNVASYLFSEIFHRAGAPYGQISVALEQGREFAQNFIKRAQKSVEDNPWDLLRKVAIYSFGIGLFMSTRHRKSPAGEK